MGGRLDVCEFLLKECGDAIVDVQDEVISRQVVEVVS